MDIDSIIKVLNEALELDREAIQKLVDCGMPCNEALSAYPTIQIGLHNKEYRVGLIDILNGIIGNSSVPREEKSSIAAEYVDYCSKCKTIREDDGQFCEKCGAELRPCLIKFTKI